MPKYSVFTEPVKASFSFNPDKILKNKEGLWRYLNFLPLQDHLNLISLGEPTTPVFNFKLNANREILVKNEMLFSSGSYKDRGAAVLINSAQQKGIKTVIQDSSGNAGCAIAAYAAAAGIACTIYLPENTAESKIAQMAAYGAVIEKVSGNRKDTSDKAMEVARENFYASHVYKADFIHGTKTFLYELFEQLEFKLPDYIFLPAGNGTLLLGSFLAIQEFEAGGFLKERPRLIAVQTHNCNPLSRHLYANLDQNSVYSPSIAEGIAIENPARLEDMAQAIKDTHGQSIDVTEAEILSAWKWLASKGHFVEPTAAACMAAILKSENNLEPDASILTVFSGSGLKSGTKILNYLS